PRHLSRAAPRCKRAETEQAATVVLLSSPASSKAPGRRVARCSVPLLIINSCMSKQRSAGHRTVNIRPQALRAGSGFMIPERAPAEPDRLRLLAWSRSVHGSPFAARAAATGEPPSVAHGLFITRSRQESARVVPRSINSEVTLPAVPAPGSVGLPALALKGGKEAL